MTVRRVAVYNNTEK